MVTAPPVSTSPITFLPHASFMFKFHENEGDFLRSFYKAQSCLMQNIQLNQTKRVLSVKTIFKLKQTRDCTTTTCIVPIAVYCNTVLTIEESHMEHIDEAHKTLALLLSSRISSTLLRLSFQSANSN